MLVPLATRPHPEVFSRSRLTNITEDTFMGSHHLGNLRVLGALPGAGMKTEYVFLITNHNVTVG